MADQPEVIQHELEQTRHSLAEKLEQIGEKISGTVETVTSTVSDVTETVTNVTEAVEGTVQKLGDAVSGTVESVKETVENVGEKAAETVESVRHAFNLSEQVQNHPWAWFGGSVAVGFVAGKLLGPRGSHTPEAESFSRGQGYYERPAESAQPSAGDGYAWGRDHGTSSQAASSQAAENSGGQSGSWLGSLFQHFGGEIDKLKGLALGTLFGVARDMVSQTLPESLKDQVVNLFNDVTQKAGGETIQGSVLGESSEGEAPGESASSRGSNYDQSGSTEMDRPVGAAERKGKAAVAKPHR